MTQLLKLKKTKASDHFQTPDWPVDLLLIEIWKHKPNWLPSQYFWDPCCGKGNIIRNFESKNLPCHGSDILTGQDFLECPINEHTARNNMVIITNPPYSLKDKFLAKCYEIKRPFALLMPLTALEGIKRQKLYKEHGLEVLLLPKRVNFETPSGKGKGAWFPTAWFTWGFNFNEKMIFLN